VGASVAQRNTERFKQAWVRVCDGAPAVSVVDKPRRCGLEITTVDRNFMNSLRTWC
jgi:hypothetical protein